MTKCFMVELRRFNQKTDAVLVRMNLRFENCEKEDVYKYIEEWFPGWDPIHIIEGFRKDNVEFTLEKN